MGGGERERERGGKEEVITLSGEIQSTATYNEMPISLQVASQPGQAGQLRLAKLGGQQRAPPSVQGLLLSMLSMAEPTHMLVLEKTWLTSQAERFWLKEEASENM